MANIFLNDETIVIGDFGFAKSGADMAETLLGTPLYMAPELSRIGTQVDYKYNSKADLWSVGVVFYQMLFGENPFYATTVAEIGEKIKKFSGENLPLPKQISANARDLLVRILQPDPDLRIDWPEVFVHPLFAKEPEPVDIFMPLTQKQMVIVNDADLEFDSHKLLLPITVEFLENEDIIKEFPILSAKVIESAF